MRSMANRQSDLCMNLWTAWIRSTVDTNHCRLWHQSSRESKVSCDSIDSDQGNSESEFRTQSVHTVRASQTTWYLISHGLRIYLKKLINQRLPPLWVFSDLLFYSQNAKLRTQKRDQWSRITQGKKLIKHPLCCNKVYVT